jgi:hypothetical protein
MINYINNYNAINPYKYTNIDNLYNCLKKGIYVGRELYEDEDDDDL